MMLRFALICSLVVGAAVPAMAQDPTTVLPDAYQLVLDNDHVRVVRVHYDAGAKLVDHTHAAGTTVYVYLNDSEGVVFRHSGRSNRAVTRPPVTTGSVRVATGGEEHHTVENPASTASDFVRIWLKTDGAGERTMRRLSPEDQAFENKQLRVTRFTTERNKAVTIKTRANEPALIVMLPTGMTVWVDGGSEKQLEAEDVAKQVVRIDLLTQPRR